MSERERDLGGAGGSDRPARPTVVVGVVAVIAVIGLLLALVASGAVVSAGQAAASNTDASPAATGSTGIDSCTTINSSGAYHLMGDIEPTNPEAWENQDSCLVINASSVTIDGNGYTIDGTSVSEEGEDVPGTRGVLVRNQTDFTDSDDPESWLSGVTIQDVGFEYWQAPVLAQGVSGMTTTDITLNNSGGAADLSFRYGSDVTVDGVDATGDVRSRIVSVNNIDDPVITDVTAEREFTLGEPIISIDTAHGATIADNTIDDSEATYTDTFATRDYGIQIANSSETTITGNEIKHLEGHEGGDGFGILFIDHTAPDDESHNATVTDNKMTDVDVGVRLASSNDSLVAENVLEDSGGVHIGAVANATITENEFVDSDLGIELHDSEAATVTDNVIDETGTGLRHIDADLELFEGNEFTISGLGVGIQFETEMDDPAPVEVSDKFIDGGGVAINRPHVSISAVTIDDGAIEVPRGIGPSVAENVTISEVEVANYDRDDPAIEIGESFSGFDDVTIEDSVIRDGEEKAFLVSDSAGLTVDNLTVTGQEAADDQFAPPTIVEFDSVTQSTVTDLTVSDTTLSDGSTLETLRVGSSSDIEFVGFASVDNDGVEPAVDIWGSENVSLTDSEFMSLEDGAIDVHQSSTDVVGSNVTFGAGAASETAASFDAHAVVIGDEKSPPEGPDATGIDRYLFVESTNDESFLDVDVSYDSGDIHGVDESSLAIWRYSDTDDAWTELADSTVDTEAQTVSANLTDVSLIGVFGEEDKAVAGDLASFEVQPVEDPVVQGEPLELEFVNATDLNGDPYTTGDDSLTNLDIETPPDNDLQRVALEFEDGKALTTFELLDGDETDSLSPKKYSDLEAWDIDDPSINDTYDVEVVSGNLTEFEVEAYDPPYVTGEDWKLEFTNATDDTGEPFDGEVEMTRDRPDEAGVIRTNVTFEDGELLQSNVPASVSESREPGEYTDLEVWVTDDPAVNDTYDVEVVTGNLTAFDVEAYEPPYVTGEDWKLEFTNATDGAGEPFDGEVEMTRDRPDETGVIRTNVTFEDGELLQSNVPADFSDSREPGEYTDLEVWVTDDPTVNDTYDVEVVSGNLTEFEVEAYEPPYVTGEEWELEFTNATNGAGEAFDGEVEMTRDRPDEAGVIRTNVTFEDGELLQSNVPASVSESREPGEYTDLEVWVTDDPAVNDTYDVEVVTGNLTEFEVEAYEPPYVTGEDWKLEFTNATDGAGEPFDGEVEMNRQRPDEVGLLRTNVTFEDGELLQSNVPASVSESREPGEYTDLEVWVTDDPAVNDTYDVEVVESEPVAPSLPGPDTDATATQPADETSVDTDGQSDETGTTVSASVENAAAGEEVTVDVPPPEQDQSYQLDSVSVTPEVDGDFDIELETSSEPLETTPDGAFEFETAEQLGYIAVDTDLESDEIEEVTFTFTVDEETIDEMGSSPESLSLYRYDEDTGEWETQATEVVAEDDGDVTFKTTAESFSEWTAAAERPDLAVSETTVDAPVVAVGESVTVTVQVSVTNTGGAEGTYDAQLRVNDEIADRQNATVPSNSTVTLEFVRSFDDPGEFELALGDDPLETVTIEARDDSDDESAGETAADETEPADDESTDEGATDDAPADGETADEAAADEAPDDASVDDDGAGFGVFATLVALLSVLALSLSRRQR